MNSKRSIRVALIGSDIQLSKSPALHEHEAAFHGLDLRYDLIDIAERGVPPDALPRLLQEVEGQGFSGVNITHPLKQSVLGYLTDLSEDARALGAVNTVVFTNGGRTGHNTDWSGFYENFETGLPGVARHHALLLGAGGAGVAVAHAALKLGIGSLSVVDIDDDRATKLADVLNARFGAGRAVATRDVAGVMRNADGVIHATPTGMRRYPGFPLDQTLLEPRHWVADIVYMPLVTPLLSFARELGCRTLDGAGMVTYQAAGAFQLFTGIRPDATRMRTHFAKLAIAEQR